MHIIWMYSKVFFWLGVGLAAAGQICNYVSSQGVLRPRLLRTFGFAFGITGTLVAAMTAYSVAINWKTLPTSPDGLDVGQLWNNGGMPVIVRKP